MPLFSSFFTVAILGYAQTALSQTLTSAPTPTLEQLDRRANPTVNGNIPTFTFNPTKSYFVNNVSPLNSRTCFGENLISDLGPESPASE